MNRWTALLLTIVVATLLSWHSADYYFVHPLYEAGDTAANSLAVDRAKHFAALYGPYSRWGFHHPGPAFFYVQAFGEWLFFDWLHLVPAPFNAQALICLFVQVGFFFAALQIFTFWLPGRARWWFLPVGLGLAVLQFGNPAPNSSAGVLVAANAFQTTWSANLVVLIFLCLLTAGASVAAGRAEDLPLLVVAGGCLVHLHVAQPLFVVPSASLAYAGLLGWFRAQQALGYGPPRVWWRRVLAAAAAAGQRHRRAHLLAGVLLAIFILPLAVDLTRGSQSNADAILQYLGSPRGERKTLGRSALYFLQFGVHSTFQRGKDNFGAFRIPAVRRYLGVHAPLFAVWVVALVLVVSAFVRQRRRWGQSLAPEPTSRFLAWAAAYLCLSVGLTLIWGTLQDGLMYYFNAYFNFAIYYFASLIAAAEAIRLTLALTPLRSIALGRVERGLAIVAIVLGVALFVQQLKFDDPAWAWHKATHDRLARAIASSTAPRAVRFLDFPQSTWVVALMTALQIERAGERFAVPDRWRIMFGPEYPPQASLAEVTQTSYQKWSLVESIPPEEQHAVEAWVELENGTFLTTEQLPKVDPDLGGTAAFDFRRNYLSLPIKIAGWSDPEPWGQWVSSKRAILTFAAAPANGDVELRLDVFPIIKLEQGLPLQRLSVFVNGERIGREMRLATREEPPIELVVPRVVWNRLENNPAGNVTLALDLPDARPLRAPDPSQPGDARANALAVERMSWQVFHPAAVRALTTDIDADRVSAPNEGGTLPSEYRFDGSPLRPDECQGVSAEGWAGPQVKAWLPRPASAAPFLRVEGVSVAGPGITYPYRFTTKVGQETIAESTIGEAGPFCFLVPLPAGTAPQNIPVILSFAQTFAMGPHEGNPQDHREISVLLRSLAVTRAQEPVFVAYGRGWYLEETLAHDAWRWSQADSVVEVAAERAGTLEVTGEANTQRPNNVVDVALDGLQCATLPLPEPAWSPIKLEVKLASGKHLLTFHSHMPGVKPPFETRTLVFGLKNVSFTLR